MSTLHDLLQPSPSPSPPHPSTLHYLNRLHTLPLSALSTTEPTTLADESAHLHRSLQSLAKRSYRSIDAAAASLTHLPPSLTAIDAASASLAAAIPALDSASRAFSSRYGPAAADSPLLARRHAALRLSANLDRVEDILALPELLTRTIAAAAAAPSAPERSDRPAPARASTHATYAQALELQTHVRRLARLQPASALVSAVSRQSDAAMAAMARDLITSLRGPSVKLAGGMRTIGLLRRVAPALTEGGEGEGALGLLFLVSRLAQLRATLDALEPLRELADAERGAAHHAERYLKRYVEVFREGAFAAVSVYRGIFPDAGPDAGAAAADEVRQTLPPALATFTAHLVELLFATLRAYLPRVAEAAARESLLTAVLYCAGSLGRLGGDFGMGLALMEEDVAEAVAWRRAREGKESEGPAGEAETSDAAAGEATASDAPADTSTASEADASEPATATATPTPPLPEWIAAMKRHRVQAGRLELLAQGAGRGGARAAAAASS